MSARDDYPSGSLGGEIRRIRALAEMFGADHLVDQINAFDTHNHQRSAQIIDGSYPGLSNEPRWIEG